MSKSLGNFRTIKDVLKEYNGQVIRYFVLLVQYRKPVDFSKKEMENARNSYERLKNIILELRDDKKENKQYLKDFEEAMNDDLNTPRALQVLWKLVRDEEAQGKIGTIKRMDKVLGLDLLKFKQVKVPKQIQDLIGERENARKSKNWKKADKLREKIRKLGYSIDDTKKGAKVKRL